MLHAVITPANKSCTSKMGPGLYILKALGEAIKASPVPGNVSEARVEGGNGLSLSELGVQ